MNHAPGDRAKTRLKAGLTAERTRYRLGLSSEIDSRGDYKVSFTLASSLVHESAKAPSVSWTNTREAKGAVIVVNTFLDENGNGVRDQGEAYLPNSDINIHPPARRTTRSTSGAPVFEGLPVNRPVHVTIEPKSDEQLFLYAPDTRHSLVLRDGMRKTLDVAVQPAGEVAGTFLLRKTDKNGKVVESPVASVPIEFLDTNGKRVAMVRTIYDGTFVASNVPFGRIAIGPSSDHIARSGMSVLTPSDERTVTLSKDMIWAEDMVILVTQD